MFSIVGSTVCSTVNSIRTVMYRTLYNPQYTVHPQYSTLYTIQCHYTCTVHCTPYIYSTVLYMHSTVHTIDLQYRVIIHVQYIANHTVSLYMYSTLHTIHIQYSVKCTSTEQRTLCRYTSHEECKLVPYSIQYTYVHYRL